MSPLARVAQVVVRVYQRVVSPRLGANCRFQPSCSEYTYEALGRFGLLRGTWLGMRRLSRCHPLSPLGVDPVPTEWVPPGRPR